MTEKQVIKALIGRTIREVVIDKENDNEVTLILDDETAICVMCDPEGNHPGSLHISFKDGAYETIGWM